MTEGVDETQTAIEDSTDVNSPTNVTESEEANADVIVFDEVH